MSIDVNMREFDLHGNLTSAGYLTFWREVDRAIKKFVQGDIKLLPCKFTPAKPAQPTRSLPVKEVDRRQRVVNIHADASFLHRIPEVHNRFTDNRKQRHHWSPECRSRSHSRDLKRDHIRHDRSRCH